MHPMTKRTALDRMSIGLLVALAAACGEPGTTTTTDGGSTGDASTTSTAGTTTGTASTGAPTTGEPGTGSTTTATTDVSTTDGSTASTSTGVATTEAPDTTTEAASSTTGGSSTGGGDPPPLTEYCDCMLGECHDQYHDKFGEDHEAAEAMCIAYAESIPSVGMPAMSGDSIECYYWACTQGDCESAFGGGACQ